MNTKWIRSAKGVIRQIGRIISHLDHLYNHACDHLNETLA